MFSWAVYTLCDLARTSLARAQIHDLQGMGLESDGQEDIQSQQYLLDARDEKKKKKKCGPIQRH